MIDYKYYIVRISRFLCFKPNIIKKITNEMLKFLFVRVRCQGEILLFCVHTYIYISFGPW